MCVHAETQQKKENNVYISVKVRRKFHELNISNRLRPGKYYMRHEHPLCKMFRGVK